MKSLKIKKDAFSDYGSKYKYPKSFRRYNLDINKDTYITINQKPSINKILKISNIKDLDKFNEKYCIIEDKKNKYNLKINSYDKLDGWSILDWDSIIKKYGGLLISIKIKSFMYFPKKGKIDKRDRWETLPIKGKRYWSWMQLPIRGKKYYDWISKWHTSKSGFIIWNINTIKKCKYIDTIIENNEYNEKI